MNPKIVNSERPKLFTAKCRRMSKRRQKKYLVRRVSDLLARFVGMTFNEATRTEMQDAIWPMLVGSCEDYLFEFEAA